jgi:hypothetical protein
MPRRIFRTASILWARCEPPERSNRYTAAGGDVLTCAAMKAEDSDVLGMIPESPLECTDLIGIRNVSNDGYRQMADS